MVNLFVILLDGGTAKIGVIRVKIPVWWMDFQRLIDQEFLFYTCSWEIYF